MLEKQCGGPKTAQFRFVSDLSLCLSQSSCSALSPPQLLCSALQKAVPKDFVGIDVHEAILKDFTDKALKGKTPFPESGTLAVIKVQPTSVWFVKKREEQEKWHLKFQLDNYADMDKLEADMREIMLELSELAFEEGQPTAQEDSVEFDIAFA